MVQRSCKTDAAFADGKYDLVILYVPLSDVSGNPTMLCTEKIFLCLTDKIGYAIVDTQLAKDTANSDICTIHSKTEVTVFCR